MKLPSTVKGIRARYTAKFPIPQGQPGPAFEETIRQWTIRHAEQVAFELPNQGWGVKRADGGRPICKDCLANNASGLITWDMLIGAGSGSPVLSQDPDSEDIPDQVFVPVTPTNHLGTTPPVEPPVEPPVPPVTPPAAPCDLSPVLDALAALSEQLAVHEAASERRYLDIIAHFEHLPQASATSVSTLFDQFLKAARRR